MKKWTTTNGCTVYQVTKGQGNSYLVLDNNVTVLVDTGLKSARGRLIKNIDDLLGEGGLSYLILTHAHYDHVGNAARIKEKYGVEIIIQRNEAEYLMKGTSSVPNGTNFITRVLVFLGRKINKFSEYEKVQPDILAEDKHVLSPNCYLIHTPGHTNGSMSLIVDDEIALVGDAMFGVFNWSVFPPFADDVPTMIKSWGKLLETDCDTYLPGHGTENSHKLLKKYYNKYKIKYTG